MDDEDDGQDAFRSQAMLKSGGGDRKRKREKDSEKEKATIRSTRPTIKKGANKKARVAELPAPKKPLETRSRTRSGN